VKVDVKGLEGLVTTVGHNQCHIVSACFHHVSDKGMAQAVTREAVGPPIVQTCHFPGFATGPRYGVVEV
jgi:hypothetical protein